MSVKFRQRRTYYQKAFRLSRTFLFFCRCVSAANSMLSHQNRSVNNYFQFFWNFFAVFRQRSIYYHRLPLLSTLFSIFFYLKKTSPFSLKFLTSFLQTENGKPNRSNGFKLPIHALRMPQLLSVIQDRKHIFISKHHFINNCTQLSPVCPMPIFVKSEDKILFL